MKRLGVLVLSMFGVVAAFAGSKTEKFKAYGTCENCEKRIETAALSVDGVYSADWNKETQMTEVVLDDSKTNVHKVEMAIAKAGHDTEMHKATDEAYNALPGCCQYQRSKSEGKMQMNEAHHH